MVAGGRGGPRGRISASALGWADADQAPGDLRRRLLITGPDELTRVCLTHAKPVWRIRPSGGVVAEPREMERMGALVVVPPKNILRLYAKQLSDAALARGLALTVKGSSKACRGERGGAARLPVRRCRFSEPQVRGIEQWVRSPLNCSLVILATSA